MALYLNPEHIKILCNNKLIYLGIININYIITNSQDIASFYKIIDLIRLVKTILIYSAYFGFVSRYGQYFFFFLFELPITC